MTQNMQAAAPLEYKVGDQPVPGYTLQRELGRGAMGVVWLARTDSGFEAAIKIIDLLKGGGKKEYRGLRTIKHKKIRHGNLLTLFDYWLKDRHGNLIPDTDELDSTDSFFAPLKPPDGPSGRPLSATTPKSLSATETGPQSKSGQPGPGAASRPTMIPSDLRHAGTLVSSGTVVNPGGRAPGSPLDATLDQRASPAPQGARPVQLIVAMELGDCTLDVRQKACQENGQPGVPVEELLPYMEQASRGLDYLHREGIVHRDVKPQNIMLVGDVAKVCDYGLIINTDADLKATSNAFTPLYASPEAVADKPVTGQSDQYSLAITYIELRTGRSPYSSETAATVYAAKETGKYDLTRVRSNPAKAVLKRALAASPHERFGSCSDFVRQLDKAEHTRPGVAGALVATAAVLLLALGGAALVPQVRQQLAALIHDQKAVDPDPPPVANPDSSKQKNLPSPPPPPPSTDIKRILADARELRLAGDYEAAAKKLAATGDSQHWSVLLERLHLDMAPAIDGSRTPTNQQWSDWQQRADRLWAQSRGEGTEHVQLAALRVLIGTRMDSAKVSLALPLAEEFAAVGAGRAYWGAVIAPERQKRLSALFEALSQQLVHSREPIPAAWTTRFADIWPEPTGSLLLVTRVRESIDEGDAAAVAAAEQDLEQIATNLGLDATPAHHELDEARRSIAEAKDKALVARVAALFISDDFLTSVTARQQFTDSLKPRPAAAKLPLVRLALLESEMADHDAANRRYPPRMYDELRDLVANLSSLGDAAAPSWLDHARFLVARTEVSLRRGDLFGPAAANTPAAKVLLDWSPAPGAWQTPRRTEQAAHTLLSLADAALPAEKDGVFSLFTLRKDQVAEPLRFAQKANELTPDSPACQGILAALLAVASQPDGDFAAVLDKANRALAGADRTSDPLLIARRPLLQYVSAYAASRSKSTTPAERDQALVRFAELLEQQFKDDDSAQPSDDSLYQFLVMPALTLAGDGRPAAQDLASALAALWSAKARLLERDDSFARVGPPQAGEPSDSFERTILAANRAYAQARELRDDVVYAAGYGRTLLKLSRKSFNANREQHYQTLQAIARQYDPQGDSANPSLRLIDAWVSWQRAITEQALPAQRQGVADSLRHYRAVGEQTAGSDPYAINSLALTLASNAHVQAAFWTPVGPGDLGVSAAAVSKNPLDMTKTQHLLEAVSLAQTAELDEGRRTPEVALISEGNGLEDLAYYCKRLENYPLAVKAFETAAGKTALRSKVYPLLSQGRCEFRWSREPADIDATRAARQTRLRQASQTLHSAIAAAGADDSRDAAEANWWLAQLLAEAGYSGPGNLDGPGGGALALEPLDRLRALHERQQPAASAELTLRLKHFAAAWKQAELAAQMASKVAPQDSVTYTVDALEIGSELAALLKKYAALLPEPKRDAVLAKVRKAAADFLENAEREPARYSKTMALRVLYVLAQSNFGIPALPDEQDLAVVTLKKHEPLFAGEGDQEKLVDVLVWQTACGGGEAPLKRALELARQIASPEHRDRALGRCLKAQADYRLTQIDKAIAAYKAAQAAGRQATKPVVNLQEVAEGYHAAELALARAAGDDVAANLAKLRRQKLSEIPALERSLSPLEAYRLRAFISETTLMRRDALQSARGWLTLADADKELDEAKRNAKFPAAAVPIARLIRDFLQPRAILREGGLTPDDRALLEIIDQKL